MSTRYFGAAVARIEDPRLLTGGGRLCRRHHAAGHAACRVRAVARRPWAHQKIDCTAARAMPGVHAVYTMRMILPTSASEPMPPMAPHPADSADADHLPSARERRGLLCRRGDRDRARRQPRQSPKTRRRWSMSTTEHARCGGRLRECRSDPTRRAPIRRRDEQSHRDSTRSARQCRARCSPAPRTCFRESFALIAAAAIPWNAAASWSLRPGARRQLTLWTSSQSPYIVRRVSRTTISACDGARRSGRRARCRRRFRHRRPCSIRKNSWCRSRRRELSRPVKWIEDRREHFLIDHAAARPVLGRWSSRCDRRTDACSACAGAASTTMAPMRHTA